MDLFCLAVPGRIRHRGGSSALSAVPLSSVYDANNQKQDKLQQLLTIGCNKRRRNMIRTPGEHASVNAEFNFVGKTFDLEHVSEQIGMRPTSSAFEQRVHGGIETSWSVCTGAMMTLDINDCLTQLLETLQPLEGIINRIQDELNLSTTILLHVRAGSDGIPSLWFSDRFLTFAHAIRAKFVDVDLYTE